MPSDAQRATLHRCNAALSSVTQAKLGTPSRTLGIASVTECRAPKRLMAQLDTAGRRIRWDGTQWVLWPWRFDP